MTKARSPAEKAKAAKERTTREIGDLKFSAEAVRYMVWRFPDPACKGKAVGCGLDYDDRGVVKRLDRFPIGPEEDGGTFGPSWARVLRSWGSGTYKFQWFADRGGKIQSIGFSPPETFNDPRYPMLPAYKKVGGEQQPGAPATAATPAAPAAAPGPDLSAAVMGAAKDGKLDVTVAMLMIQLVQAQATTAQSMFQGWMDQERDRRAELESDYQRRRERDAQWARDENERLATFWAGQLKVARELNRDGGGDGGDDRFETLADSIETLAETVQKQGKAQEETWEKLLNSPIAQTIAARLMGQPETPKVGP